MARTRSLRTRVVVAMGATAVVMVGAIFLGASALERSQARRAANRESATVTRVISQLLTGGATNAQIRMAALTFGDERILVDVPGHRLTLGPLRPPDQVADRLVTTVRPVPGGTVLASAPMEATANLALEVAALGAVVLSLMLGIGLVGGRVLTRGVSGPIETMVDAADRVAAGDFSARIGAVSSTEMTHLAHAFDDMASRLEQSDVLQRQFLGDLAHEIATPINALAGFAMALADGTVSSDGDRAEASEVIDAETARLLGLLAALRGLERLDLAEATDLARFDPAELVRSVVGRMQRVAREGEVRLRVRTRAGSAYGDARLVEMMVDNLVSNAVRYTPAGGSVDVALREDGDLLQVVVHDTGIGIGAADKARIFDRLYRVDEARTRSTGGFGIGLALVQRGALALGGRVEVDSEPGKGSEFRVWFRRDLRDADTSLAGRGRCRPLPGGSQGQELV